MIAPQDDTTCIATAEEFDLGQNFTAGAIQVERFETALLEVFFGAIQVRTSTVYSSSFSNV
jgi:hypothetical protein